MNYSIDLAAAGKGSLMTSTPGPWVITKHKLNFGRVIAQLAHADRPFGASVDLERHRNTYVAPIAHVCDEKSRHFTSEEAEANARLIAAAPDLLDTLKKVASDMRCHIESLRLSTGCPDLTPKQCAWAQYMETAIAKAEGRMTNERGFLGLGLLGGIFLVQLCTLWLLTWW